MISSTADNRKLAAKEDAIQRVIRAMKECSGSASVQEAACKAIINLTAKNSEYDNWLEIFSDMQHLIMHVQNPDARLFVHVCAPGCARANIHTLH